NLTPGVARPVGKEPVVIATCARRAYREAPHPGGRRLLGNQRAQIYIARSGGGMASQLFAHFGADFVAAPANRWSEVNRELAGRVFVALEHIDGFRQNTRRGDAPSGVKERDYSGRLRD